MRCSKCGSEVTRSLAAGCDQHVSKPVRKPVLLAAIRKAMATRSAAGEPEQPAVANPRSRDTPDPPDSPELADPRIA
jgi:hypothetical protein